MSLDTSFYYRLTNKFQGPGQSLDVHSDGSRRLKMAPTADFSGQHWRLIDLGSGKYALRTQYLGECFSLDVINDGANDKPWLNTTGNFTGQSWSLTQWADKSFKLSNDFTGSGKSLNVRAQSFEPFVGEGDFSGQHWVLTQLKKIFTGAIPQFGEMARDNAQDEGPTNYAIFTRPQGTVRAVMLFVDFPDAPAGSQTPQQAADQILGREKFLPSFGKRYAAVRLFNEESYGKLTLDVDVKSDLGWKRMPINSSGYSLEVGDSQRHYITHAAKLFTHLFSPLINFGAYNFVYIVPPSGAAPEKSPAFNQAPGDGVATLTGEIRFAVTFGQDAYSNRFITLVHETGHLFGLPDLYFDTQPPETSEVGCWDIMSDTFRSMGFFGWHRHKFGWLDPSRKLYIPQSTTGWHVTLSPLSGGCGVSMIVLPIDDPAKPSKVFVVELSQPIMGWKTNRPGGEGGVLLYTVDAKIKSLFSPVVVLRDFDHKTSEFGRLYDVPFGVGQSRSYKVDGATLTVKVDQKIGDCYNLTMSYGRH